MKNVCAKFRRLMLSVMSPDWVRCDTAARPMAELGHRTNPLARERAAREAEQVARPR
jgi:hypothetical protein